MIQKTFGIYTEATDADELFIELGTTHVACWTMNSSDEVSSFEFFHADHDTRTYVKEIFKEVKLYSKLLDTPFQNVSVVLDNECCLLLPKLNLTEDQKNELLRLAFGETAESRKITAGTDIVYLFSVHNRLHEFLQDEFPGATIKHKYEWLKHEPAEQFATDILLTCYLEHCIFSVKQSNTYLLVQRYTYETPDDVVYYLLNICKQLNVELQDASVTVQGLVDAESKLYAELYKYIPNIQLHSASDLKFSSDAFAEYPAHYFTSFINHRA